jgi:hypothetical protein
MRAGRGIGLFAFALWLGLAPPALAQAEPLTPGREVRLYMQGVIAPFEGTLTANAPDALTVTLLDGSEFTLSPEQLQRAEVLGTRRNVVRGAMAGGVLGIVAGVWLVVEARDDCSRDLSGFCNAFGDSINEWHLVAPPLAGATAGALVGYFIRTPRWVPGLLPLASLNGRVGLAATWTVPLGS